MSDNPQPQKTNTADTQTIQNHEGSGDNVGRDKIIIQAVSPTEIRSPVEEILTVLRYRRPDKAREKLSILEKQSNLNSDSIDLLKALLLAIDLAEKIDRPDAHQELTRIIITTSVNIVADIATSTLIRLEASQKNITNARDRFKNLEVLGPHAKEIFFEFVADVSEIEHAYEKEKLTLSETELCGLIRGSIRLQAFTLTLSMANYLYSIAPSFNSKVLLIIANSSALNSELTGKHYWYIASTSRTKLLDICDECKTLLVECEGKDPRVLELSSSLALYVIGEYKPLLDTCWNYIAEFEKLSLDISKRLRHLYQPEAEVADDNIVSKIKRANSDRAYKKSIITKIISEEEISAENSVLLSSIGDRSSIQKWILSGGTVKSTDAIERDFSILELKILSCDGTPKNIESIRTDIQKFITEYYNKIPNLNPSFVLELANSLSDLDLSTEVCDLLKPLIPETDIWVSPIVRCYLNALINSHQLMTLNSALGEIEESNWDGYIWQIKARQLDLQQSYGEAIKAIKESLANNPMSLYSWYFLVYLHKRMKAARNSFPKR